MHHRVERAVLGIALLMVACSPAQRRAAGGGVFGLGAVTAGLGAVLLDPCGLYDNPYDRRQCRETERPRYEDQGLQMIGIGAGVAALGGILYATGLKWHPPRPKPWNIQMPAAAPPAR